MGPCGEVKHVALVLVAVAGALGLGACDLGGSGGSAAPEGQVSVNGSPDPGAPQPGSGTGASGADTQGEGRVDPNALHFGRDVAPLLDRHCGECHHAGRDLDLTHWPPAGDPARVASRVLELSESNAMPPKPREPMPKDAIATVRRWVHEGMNP